MHQMTPRTSRVAMYAQMQVGINLMRKFRDQQAKAAWSIPEHALNRIHALTRFALIAPLPFSWKNESCANIVFDLLIKESVFPKDMERSHPDRTAMVKTKIRSHASHIRSGNIKAVIQRALEVPYTNIYDLTHNIVNACKIKADVTREVLAGIAYLRHLVHEEMIKQGQDNLDRKVWDVFELSLKRALKSHATEEARTAFLEACLKRDIERYGRYDPDVVLASVDSSGQAEIFQAMRSGRVEISPPRRSRR
ncbi:hypothetical protein C8Q78DRAFT_1064093 [Trametes maxima]|nr:hypothetical protein C8Q78DRAFT_1064093 [Trametes maxima]